MHPTLLRLYTAFGIPAQEKGAPTRLASAMNRSAQVITNWAQRGVSIDGAVDAERLSGALASWILDGPQPHGRGGAVVAMESDAPVFHPPPRWPFKAITPVQFFGALDSLTTTDRLQTERDIDELVLLLLQRRSATL